MGWGRVQGVWMDGVAAALLRGIVLLLLLQLPTLVTLTCLLRDWHYEFQVLDTAGYRLLLLLLLPLPLFPLFVLACRRHSIGEAPVVASMMYDSSGGNNKK